MTTTAPTPDIKFTKVDAIPEQVRASGNGRQAIRWDERLAPVKQAPGESFLTWSYEKKTAATSRVAAIRNQLFKDTPADNWTLAVRLVPNSEPEAFGIYVQYNGTFTPEQVAARAKERSDRAEKTRKANEARKAAEGAIGAEAPVTPQTPAQKVAATKAAAGK